MKNRRAHIRYDLGNDISYVQDSACSNEVFNAIAANISDAGMSVYAFSPLQCGQEITITRGMEDAYRKCAVVWCKELGDGVFKAGLVFRVSE